MTEAPRPGPAEARPRLQGELTAWNDERGYGFITPAGGNRRVFVHISAFPRSSARPGVGDEVSFVSGRSSTGKPEATVAELSRPPTESVAEIERRRAEYRRGRGAQNLVSYVIIVAFVVLYLVISIFWVVPWWVGAIYVVASAASFAVYFADKQAAAAGGWRTSESTLLAVGLVGGWPGSIVAQQVLRHKTRKRSFQLAFYGCVTLNVVAFVVFTSPPVAALFR